MENWYNTPLKKIIAFGGGGLLALYNNSLSAALEAVYPEVAWQRHRFAHSPHNLYQQWEVVEDFIKYASKRLYIESLDDWHRVSQDQLWRIGGGQLVAKNGGLQAVRE